MKYSSRGKSGIIFLLILIAAVCVCINGCNTDQFIEEDSHPEIVLDTNQRGGTITNSAIRANTQNETQVAKEQSNEAVEDVINIGEPSFSRIPTQYIVGEFVTKYNVKNKNRANNVELASQSLNGTIVYPGDTFSYNDVIGPTTKANGYKKATVFRNGKEYKGYGGGVCQVSSTLFNACVNAGVEIVEQHNHTKEVAYVEKGRDAAVAYGKIDFQFKNNKKYPIVIHASTKDGALSVTLKSYMF